MIVCQMKMIVRFSEVARAGCSTHPPPTLCAMVTTLMRFPSAATAMTVMRLPAGERVHGPALRYSETSCGEHCSAGATDEAALLPTTRAA